MRIFHLRISSRRRGFSFVEVMVALSILTALILIVFPNIQRLLVGEREREFRRLANVIRLARQEAVLTQLPHRLVLELPENQYFFEARDHSGKFVPVKNIRALAQHKLPESLVLIDLLLYGETADRLIDQRVSIRIDSTGFIDRFLLHVREGETDWTFRTSLLGRADWLEGYHDEPLL